MAYCVLSGKLLDMVGKPLARASFKFTSSSNSTSIINAVDTIIAWSVRYDETYAIETAYQRSK